MGIMGRVLGAGNAVRGVGDAVGGVAEVFVGNRAAREAAQNEQYLAAVAQHSAEFEQVRTGRFDRFMDGLNRLPRPLLVIGTLGLFVYAMAEPAGFALRMEGLALVPEPLWWLLGAIVSFYFGSRELHYQRVRSELPVARLAPVVAITPEADDPEQPEPEKSAADVAKKAPAEQAELRPRPAPARAEARTRPAAMQALPKVQVRARDPHFNAAIEEWRQRRS